MSQQTSSSQRTSGRCRTIPKKFNDYETNDGEMKKVTSDNDGTSSGSDTDGEYKDSSFSEHTDDEVDDNASSIRLSVADDVTNKVLETSYVPPTTRNNQQHYDPPLRSIACTKDQAIETVVS